jgi:hypothetical protein
MSDFDSIYRFADKLLHGLFVVLISTLDANVK